MSPIVAVALLGVLLAAPESSTAPSKAEFRIWAVEVHAEGRDKPFFDKGLEEVRDALKDPKNPAFDTYVNLKTAKQVFKDEKPVETAITDKYTLATSPPAKSGDGRYRVKLRLTMKSGKKPAGPPPASPLLPGESLLPPQKNVKPQREIEALSSELLLQPEKPVAIRGLKLDEGKEMILVVSLTAPAD